MDIPVSPNVSLAVIGARALVIASGLLHSPVDVLSGATPHSPSWAEDRDSAQSPVDVPVS